MAKHILMLNIDPSKNIKLFLKEFTGKAIQWKLKISDPFKECVVYQKNDDTYVLFDNVAKQPILDLPKILVEILPLTI